MEDPWNSLTIESTPFSDQDFHSSSNQSPLMDPLYPIDPQPAQQRQRSRRKRKTVDDVQDHVDTSRGDKDAQAEERTPSLSQEKRLKQETSPISPEDNTESTQLKDLVSPKEYQAFRKIHNLIRSGKRTADKNLRLSHEFEKEMSQLLSIMLASNYRVSKEPALRRRFSSVAVDEAKRIIKKNRLEVSEGIRRDHPEEFKLFQVVEHVHYLLRQKTLIKKTSKTDTE